MAHGMPIRTHKVAAARALGLVLHGWWAGRWSLSDPVVLPTLFPNNASLQNHGTKSEVVRVVYRIAPVAVVYAMWPARWMRDTSPALQ